IAHTCARPIPPLRRRAPAKDPPHRAGLGLGWSRSDRPGGNRLRILGIALEITPAACRRGSKSASFGRGTPRRATGTISPRRKWRASAAAVECNAARRRVSLPKLQPQEIPPAEVASRADSAPARHNPRRARQTAVAPEQNSPLGYVLRGIGP